MKQPVRCLIVVIISIGATLLLFRNFSESDGQKLTRRANADFISNVLPKFSTCTKHEFRGYRSISPDSSDIFLFEIQDVTGKHQIAVKYRWVSEMNDWGYIGWKENNDAP